MATISEAQAGSWSAHTPGMLKLMPPVFSNYHGIGQVFVKYSAREWLTDLVFLDLVDGPSVLVFLV